MRTRWLPRSLKNAEAAPERGLRGALSMTCQPFGLHSYRCNSEAGFGTMIQGIELHSVICEVRSCVMALPLAKGAVERLCRGADPLLSRPGWGAGMRFADQRYLRRFPAAAKRF